MSFSAAGGAQSPARRLCFSRGAGFAEKSAKILREGLFFWAGIWYDKEHGLPYPTKIAKAIFVGALVAAEQILQAARYSRGFA